MSDLRSSAVRASGHAAVGAFVLAISIGIAAISMVLYAAWWTASLIAFGLMVFILARRGASLEATAAIAVTVGGSFLAIGFGAFLAVMSQFGFRTPCPPTLTCTDPTSLWGFAGLGLIALGILGLVLSARWLRRRSSGVRKR